MKRVSLLLGFIFIQFFSTSLYGQLWKEYTDTAQALRKQNKYADAILYFNKSLGELKKESISDAFYHAQTTMKNKYRNNPYKWAAWILVR